MICVLAMFVFAVLGLFSANYRTLAGEAFNCVFRRVTLRPCDTGFDNKMKMKIVGKLMNTHKGVAGFVFKNFEALSWSFTILFFASLILAAQGVYNLAVYGTCDPVSNVCVFNPQQPGCECEPGAPCTHQDCGPGCTCKQGTCEVV